MTMPAKVWLRFFFIGYIVLMGLWIVSLTSPIPYGDLTRIGRLSEREFGWTAPPPKVDPALLKGTPVDQADIMVIGDSFSMTFRWQSKLVRPATASRPATGVSMKTRCAATSTNGSSARASRAS
jgi:hypothetical protein